MRKLYTLGIALTLAASAHAAPNVTNASQKGSLLIFPDIRVDGESSWNTLVRIQNDGGHDVDVKCYWMDGNKNRLDFILRLTANQPVWFDARTGRGTHQVNPFPQGPANGFANPFLGGFAGPYHKGLLACWAVDDEARNQVKWNHLSGTATLYETEDGAYEYNAYAFFVADGLDLAPVGTPGTLALDGQSYDSCPLYQVAQFTPAEPVETSPQPPGPAVYENRFAIVGCTLDLKQDWQPVFTKLQLDVWNEEEVKFTGAFDCADSWHEMEFTASNHVYSGINIDSGADIFTAAILGTYAARVRIQGVQSTQCRRRVVTVGEVDGEETEYEVDEPVQTQDVGLIAVHSKIAGSFVVTPSEYAFGTTMTNAGKFTGGVLWDPVLQPTPEGGVR